MRAARKPKRQYRILIADRGGIFRIGLKKVFAVEDDFRVVAQGENATQVPDLARRFRADLLFIQAELTQEGRGDLLERLRRAMPKVKILITIENSGFDEPQNLVKRGASGVVLRSSDPAHFVNCAHKVFNGEVCLPKPPAGSSTTHASKPVPRPADTLTRREKSIISCLLQGWRNREIAGHLTITEQTVKNHLRTIFDKVGVSDRLELVLYAIHHRLELPPVSPATSS